MVCSTFESKMAAAVTSLKDKISEFVYREAEVFERRKALVSLVLEDTCFEETVKTLHSRYYAANALKGAAILKDLQRVQSKVNIDIWDVGVQGLSRSIGAPSVVNSAVYVASGTVYNGVNGKNRFPLLHCI